MQSLATAAGERGSFGFGGRESIVVGRPGGCGGAQSFFSLSLLLLSLAFLVEGEREEGRENGPFLRSHYLRFIALRRKTRKEKGKKKTQIAIEDFYKSNLGVK